MPKKYQKGIQEIVLKIIEDAKRKKLPYITKKDIIINIIQQGIKLKNAETQISQALYQLQRKTKYRRPRIRKFKDKKGIVKGWTTVEEEHLFDPWYFPQA